tara:strand:- start:2112 stop:2783 length:672 start_codon:yes stop_codon:yes gene_type:complete
MKQKELIELVQQHHPNMGNVEIRARLNRAQNDFCARTELIKKTYTQSTTAGKRYYALDNDILKILKVQLDDIYISRLVHEPVIDDDEFDGATGRTDSGSGSNEYYWYISNDRIGIVEKVSGGLTINNITSNYISVNSAKEIRLYTISQATDFGTTLTQESDLPVQFREGLAHRVIADGYLKGESLNPELHNLFMQKYQVTVKEGKKQARSNYQYTGTITPTDF